MSASATLLRVAVTYAALLAEVEASQLEAADRTEAVEAVAAISLLAVLADVDALAAVCSPAVMDVAARAVVLDVLVEVGEYLVYREFVDAFATGDAVVVELEKRLSDPVAADDVATVSPMPGANDPLSTSELLVMLSAKRLADAVTAVDSASVMSFSVLGGAALSDGPHPADAAALEATKPVADVASAPDAAAIAAGKALADAISASDAAVLTWLSIREEWDGVLADDDVALNLTIAASDSAAAADGALLLDLAKAMADAAVAADLAQLALSRAVSDAVAAADAHAMLHSKLRVEAVMPMDGGTLSLSEYAIDYFDEDYVLSDVSAF